LLQIAHDYCLLLGKKLEGLVLSGRSYDFKSEFVKVKEGKTMDRPGFLVDFLFI
jgi:hypothetical protein